LTQAYHLLANLPLREQKKGRRLRSLNRHSGDDLLFHRCGNRHQGRLQIPAASPTPPRKSTAFFSFFAANGFFQVSWSRITIQSQTLISDAKQLSQLLGAQVDQLHLVNVVLIFGVIAAFSVFLVIIYVQTFRRTLKSVLDLRKGAPIIGSGNLDYKLEETKKDEIEDVSRSFNQMTYNLKAVTASKTD
jgi:methyl-accepting chemotaxis protein